MKKDTYYIFGRGPHVAKKVKELLDAHGKWSEKHHPDRAYFELSYSSFYNAEGEWIGRHEIDAEGDPTYNIVIA